MKKKIVRQMLEQQSRLIAMQDQTMQTMSMAIGNMEEQNYNLIRTVQELAHEDVSQRRMQEIKTQFPRQQ